MLCKLYTEKIALMWTTTCRKLLLSQSQRFFEQGERTGRLLAWLAKERFTTFHILNIRDSTDTLHADPFQINIKFALFYEHLYTSRADYTLDSMTECLDSVDFLELLASTRQRLDAPFTLKEIQVAIASLQTGKTPGPDGLPAKFYKANVDVLASHFHELLQTALKDDSLPPSMWDAVIVVVPKPNKDPELCAS